jgi:hypothetical protein
LWLGRGPRRSVVRGQRGSVPPGSESRAKAQSRFPRNVGDPAVSTEAIPDGATGRPTPGPRPQHAAAAGAKCACSRGTVKRRQRSTAGEAAGSRSALIVPQKRGNSIRGDPGEGSGASSYNTVGGKHGGDIGLRHRVHETTTDSNVGEAVAADGVHFLESPPRSGMAPRGISAYAQRRRGGCGRTNGRRVRGAPGGKPSVAFGAGEVRHVPGAAGPQGAYSERDGWRDPPDRNSHAGRQSAPAGGRDVAGADLRAGLSRRLVRIPARAIGAPGVGQPVEADHAERWGMDSGSGHPQVFRHAGSRPSAGASPATRA